MTSLRSVPQQPDPALDPEHGICPDCEGAGEIRFNASQGGEPWFEDSALCRRCHGDGWLGDVVPTQEFEVGERVRCHTFAGTVTQYVPQVHADNLYRVLWDSDPDDMDLYPVSGLVLLERAA
jgi:hypothetical protein